MRTSFLALTSATLLLAASPGASPGKFDDDPTIECPETMNWCAEQGFACAKRPPPKTRRRRRLLGIPCSRCLRPNMRALYPAIKTVFCQKGGCIHLYGNTVLEVRISGQCSEYEPIVWDPATCSGAPPPRPPPPPPPPPSSSASPNSASHLQHELALNLQEARHTGGSSGRNNVAAGAGTTTTVCIGAAGAVVPPPHAAATSRAVSTAAAATVAPAVLATTPFTSSSKTTPATPAPPAPPASPAHTECQPAPSSSQCKSEWHCATCRAGANERSDCLSCVAGAVFALQYADCTGLCNPTTPGASTTKDSATPTVPASAAVHAAQSTNQKEEEEEEEEERRAQLRRWSKARSGPAASSSMTTTRESTDFHRLSKSAPRRAPAKLLLPGTAANVRQPTMSLLTSYFANDHTKPHTFEIESALIANVRGAATFEEVCVVYDSINSHQNCSTLRLALGLAAHSKFTCVDRLRGQPSYREMYEYAFSLPLRGEVVVLSNADIVFDKTIDLLRPIQPNKLTVLSVTGGPRDSPPDVQRFYPAGWRLQPPGRIFNHCLHWERNGRRVTCSWDAYVFRRDSVVNMGKSRTLFRDTRTGREYPMNQLGAENAALAAMRASMHLYHDQNFTFSDACLLVHAWHFHQKPKMHALKSRVGNLLHVAQSAGCLWASPHHCKDNVSTCLRN